MRASSIIFKFTLISVSLALVACGSTSSNVKFDFNKQLSEGAIKPGKIIELESVPRDYTDPGPSLNWKDWIPDAELLYAPVLLGKLLIWNLPSSLPRSVANKMLEEKATIEGDSALNFPIHGNWCGAGFPEPDNQNAKIESPVDAACKAHDNCYKKNPNSCACDNKLISNINGIEGYKRLPLLFRDWFARSYCRSSCKFAVRWKNSYIYQANNSPWSRSDSKTYYPDGVIGRTLMALLSYGDRKFKSTSQYLNTVCFGDEEEFNNFIDCAKGVPGDQLGRKCLTIGMRGIFLDYERSRRPEWRDEPPPEGPFDLEDYKE